MREPVQYLFPFTNINATAFFSCCQLDPSGQFTFTWQPPDDPRLLVANSGKLI
ncbi:hypothetical protein [Parapedobacter sp.]